MQEIYCFSGLGADRRVFQRLDFGGYRPVFIEWLSPLPHERLSDYARRLLPQITASAPTLLGVSFGGIVALEVAALLPGSRVILLSSIQTRDAIPWYFRLTAAIPLHQWLPSCFFKRATPFTYWLFGVPHGEDRRLLQTILRETDVRFLRWAMHALVNWPRKARLESVFHIHGTRDRILPMRAAHTSVAIPAGGHLMLLTQAREVSAAIQRALLTD